MTEVLDMLPHPFSEFQPPYVDEEYEALVASIDEFGAVRDPIVLFEGKILDGRHRRNAVVDLWEKKQRMVPFTVRNFDPETEGDPLQFVIDKHTRRNLTAGQKAVMALQYIDTVLLPAKKKGEKTGGEGRRDVAGRRFGVSGKYVDMAKDIREYSAKTKLPYFEQLVAGAVDLFPTYKAIEEDIRSKKQEADVASGKAGSDGRERAKFKWECQRSTVLAEEGMATADAWIIERPDDESGKIIYGVTVVMQGLPETRENRLDIDEDTLGHAQMRAIGWWRKWNAPKEAEENG